MKYEQPAPLSHSDAQAHAESESATVVANALVAVSLFEPDRVWAEEFVLRHLQDAREDVAGAAATSLGNLARRFRYLSPESIESVRRAADDPRIAGRAEDALDDINSFVGQV